MKVIVTGGRDYSKVDKVWDVLTKLGVKELVVGDCPTGVDKFATLWVDTLKRSCSFRIYRADWAKHGKAAGPIRNKEMIANNLDADFLLSFDGGKGTENCTNTAIAYNLTVLKVC